MDKTKIKKLRVALGCFAVFAALLCAIEYFPNIEYLGSLSLLYLPAFIAAIPLILVYVYVYCGYYYGTAISIIGFGGGVLLGFSAPVFLAAAFLPLILTASYMIYSQKRFRTSVIASGIAALAGVVLVFLIVTQTTGMSVVEYAVNYYGYQLKSLDNSQVKLIYEAVRYPDILTGAVTQEAIDATLAADAVVKMQDILKESLNIQIVYIMVVYASACGYLAYIIPRAVLKKQGRFVVDIPKLKDYELPRRLWLAALLMLAGAFLGESLDLRGFDIAFYTVFQVFTFVFMIQGFCVLMFFLEQRKMHGALKTVLIISALLFLRTVALPIIGLLENALKFRQKIKMGEGQA